MLIVPFPVGIPHRPTGRRPSVSGFGGVGRPAERDEETRAERDGGTQRDGEHHVTAPGHDPLQVGALAAVLADVEEHLGLDREALLDEMFGGTAAAAHSAPVSAAPSSRRPALCPRAGRPA